MDETLKEHVERLIKAAGHNVTSASVAAGLNQHYLRQWLSGRVRSPGTEKLGKIADVLGVTRDELLTPGLRDIAREGYEHDSNTIHITAKPSKPIKIVAPRQAPIRVMPPLPVRHIVQAGAWIESDEMGQARLQSPPVSADTTYPANIQWLELVRGDSMDQFYPEGSWVHVVDAIAIGYAARDADFVTVERRRQQGGLIERSLKQIAIKRGRVELWPRSRNPKWKGPLHLSESADEETVVEIAALVIGGYWSARR